MNIQQIQELEKTIDNLLTNRGWKQQPQPHSACRAVPHSQPQPQPHSQPHSTSQSTPQSAPQSTPQSACGAVPHSVPHSYIYNNPNYSIYDEVRICWMDDYVKISVPVKNFPFLYVSKFEYSVATDSEIVSFIENHVSAYERVRH